MLTRDTLAEKSAWSKRVLGPPLALQGFQFHRSTATNVPAGHVVAGGTLTKPLAVAIELKMWDAWLPADLT